MLRIKINNPERKCSLKIKLTEPLSLGLGSFLPKFLVVPPIPLSIPLCFIFDQILKFVARLAHILLCLLHAASVLVHGPYFRPRFIIWKLKPLSALSIGSYFCLINVLKFIHDWPYNFFSRWDFSNNLIPNLIHDIYTNITTFINLPTVKPFVFKCIFSPLIILVQTLIPFFKSLIYICSDCDSLFMHIFSLGLIIYFCDRLVNFNDIPFDLNVWLHHVWLHFLAWIFPAWLRNVITSGELGFSLRWFQR